MQRWGQLAGEHCRCPSGEGERSHGAGAPTSAASVRLLGHGQRIAVR
jgi:hypothetical protein